MMSAAESDHVFVVESSDVFAELGARHGGQLVDHQPAGLAETVVVVWIDRHAEQWCVRGVGGHRAHGDRAGGVEAVVLHDDDRAGFADVAAACGGGPGSRRASLLVQAERVDECLIVVGVCAACDRG